MGCFTINYFNPLNAELNPICHLLALSGAHHILHVSRIRDKCVFNQLLVVVNRQEVLNTAGRIYRCVVQKTAVTSYLPGLITSQGSTTVSCVFTRYDWPTVEKYGCVVVGSGPI
jgi:hypothetical protein